MTYPSYQRLVQYKTDGDKGSTDVEGDLASSWKASDDQKEWTFTLKDNAKFADGTPVTAEAVKLSFERLLKIGQGPAEAFPKDLKIDAPDEHTVKFTLSQPFAPFLYTLANDGASIINPAVLKEHAADDARGFLAQNTAGSGPFMLKSWQKGQQLVLVPNPHYPGNKPNFKRVSVKIIGESASRRLQLSRGDIDIADALPVDQLNALKQENKVNVAEYPSLRVTYLYLNNSKAPLNQADLRRAISWSTDYQGMVNGILSGNGKQMRGPIPEGMWGYDATAMQAGRRFAHSVDVMFETFVVKHGHRAAGAAQVSRLHRGSAHWSGPIQRPDETRPRHFRTAASYCANAPAVCRPYRYRGRATRRASLFHRFRHQRAG